MAALAAARISSGADIILTNTFGCNRHRLKLHNAQSRVHELASGAARLARAVADASARPVVVAGSVGPTGELFEPLGALTEADAIDSFAEQIRGLQDGGADVVWIETMSAPEEIRAAAKAAILVGMPYAATMSFDTAGRTMMGIMPDALEQIFEGLEPQPLAIGANCGVGASDILVSISQMKAFATPTHNAGACVGRHRRIGMHQFGRARIFDGGSFKFWNAAVALGHHGCCEGFHLRDGNQDVGCTDAAIKPNN